MIEDLHIENFALIERLHLEFTPGMNAFTGETGAGKSILAGALGLLLGMKATTGMIRNGEEQSVVSGTFIIPQSSSSTQNLHDWLSDRGIEDEDGRVLIRRILKSTGKGNCYLQNTMVTRQDLEDFTSMLVDMHGQHEHQSLFSIIQHRKLIDAYGNLDSQVEQIQRDFLYLSEKRKELDTLISDEGERQREMELLAYAIKEIQQLNLQLGEDEELENERQRLHQYENLFSHIESSYSALEENGGASLGGVYTAMDGMKRAAAIDPGQKETADRLSSLYYELEDVFSQISNYRDDLSYDPQRLEFIEERLAELSRVKRKYGSRIQDVLEYSDTAATRLEQYEHSDEYRAKLEKEISDCESQLIQRSQELSVARKSASRRIEGQVMEILASLGMEKARFAVSVTQKLSDSGVPVCSATGIDRVEFLLAANAGEPLKPLRNVASGGEISRIMLAIKTALAESDDIPTLVFDEIDSGIGGEVGRALGSHLHILSSTKQILCITHLASVAAQADNHIILRKSEHDGRTRTDAMLVSGQDRQKEIARMLSGDSASEVSLEHARQLLARR